METIQEQTIACNTVPIQTEQRRAFFLSEIRCLALHARITATELDSIGTALRGGLITPEVAAEWVGNLGLLDCLREAAR